MAPRPARWLLVAAALAGCTSRATGPDEPLRGQVDADEPEARGLFEAVPGPGLPPEHPPFGFWGLNGFVNPRGLSRTKERLGLEIFHTSHMLPDQVVYELLPMARRQGVRVSLRLTGGHEHYRTWKGDFDLEAWKAIMERWRHPKIGRFIEDGTLFAHMLLDDIHNFSGTDPTAEELDEMARVSEEILPGLLTFVREEATEMPVPRSGRYQHLDAIVNQWRSRDGDPRGWARAQETRARELDLRVINGLNIANGGDGQSGQPGWQEGRWAMSAGEIRFAGKAMTDIDSLGMFLCWEYDGEERWSDGSVGSDYFDQPELTEALFELGERVQARPYVELQRP